MTNAGDLEVGSFTHDGPWEVVPAELEWARQVQVLRVASEAWATAQSRPPLLPPVRRLVEVALTLRSAWGGAGFRADDGGLAAPGRARRLRKGFSRLGATYIKLGQLLSSGRGFFPDELVDEFTELRDRVPAEPLDAIRRLVESELGRPLHEVFSEFEEEPLAAASIAQVHVARLVTGEEVVVKVQRPSVSSVMRRDLRALSWLAPRLTGRIPVAALANPPALVELFAQQISEELDFRLEAQNMLDVARVLAETGQRSIVVPRPHPTLVTRKVLVMQRLHGFGFDDVEGMRAAGVDTSAVVRAALISLLEGALIHGVFHGDLHGGNMLVTTDGHIALLDFGITGRFDDRKRRAFLKVLLTRNDPGARLEALRDLGAFPPDADLSEFEQRMRERRAQREAGADGTAAGSSGAEGNRDEMAADLQQVVQRLLDSGAKVPKELLLFSKCLIFIDGAIATLAPDIDLVAELLHVVEHFREVHGRQIAADIGIDLAEVPVVPNRVDGTRRVTHRDVRARRTRAIEERAHRRRQRRAQHETETPGAGAEDQL